MSEYKCPQCGAAYAAEKPWPCPSCSYGSELASSGSSPIPAIESAVLNIGTAISDCESARTAWVYDKWNDCTMWISNAIAQLEAARSKIYAHQEAENSDYAHQVST